MSRPEPDARTAADLLHARLATQLEALDRELVAVRAGHPEGVHQARIACRRLRSALATFRPLFDPDVIKRFKDEVKEVKEGFECGMAFENYEDIKVGDIIEAYEVEEIARELVSG